MSELTNRRKVAVGVFIFLGLAVLVIGIFTIGNQHKAFVKSIAVKAVFDDVQGLQSGNNVWLSGMKVGTVKKVAFYGNTQVEITMNIEKQAQPHIRKNANVKISTDGLVGNKIVVIYGGTEDAPLIAENDHLQSQRPAGLEEMMTTLQANNANLLEVTGNLKTISRKLTTGQGTLGALINDASMADNLKASIVHLQAASEGSRRMIANLDNFTEGLHRPGSLANELVTDTTVFHNLRGTVTKLNEAAATASEFTQTLKNAGDGLNDKNTPLGMFLHDEDVATDLQRTIKNLRESSKELDDDLEAVQHSFLLKGFFKKRKKD